MTGKTFLDNARHLCSYCFNEFTPHPKVGDRQKCCDRASCKKTRKREANQQWRKNNPGYDNGRYQTSTKPWLEKNPGYLEQWRQRKKDREAMIDATSSTSKNKHDIQDKLTVEKAGSYLHSSCDIQDKLTCDNSIFYRVFGKLADIQDELKAVYPLSGKPCPQVIYKTT